MYSTKLEVKNSMYDDKAKIRDELIMTLTARTSGDESTIGNVSGSDGLRRLGYQDKLIVL